MKLVESPKASQDAALDALKSHYKRLREVFSMVFPQIIGQPVLNSTEVSRTFTHAEYDFILTYRRSPSTDGTRHNLTMKVEKPQENSYVIVWMMYVAQSPDQKATQCISNVALVDNNQTSSENTKVAVSISRDLPSNITEDELSAYSSVSSKFCGLAKEWADDHTEVGLKRKQVSKGLKDIVSF